MPTYGQTSKELEEEFEKEEEPIERKYVKMFPKSHSSLLPRARLDVGLPNSMNYMGGLDSIRMTIPKSDIYNKEWRNFDTRLFKKRKV